MKALLDETKKSQEASKPEQTTRFKPKEQSENMKMKVYSNTKDRKRNSVD